MLQVYCRNIKVTIAQRGERDRRGKGRTLRRVDSRRRMPCIEIPGAAPCTNIGSPSSGCASHPVPNISYDVDHYFTTSRQMGYNP